MSRAAGAKNGVWTHGKYSTYKRGCRCDECHGAHEIYLATERSRRNPDNQTTHAGKSRLYWREYAASRGCEVCGSFERLCVDHDHSCCPGTYGCEKCVRGVLCSDCNWALGLVKDNPARLRALLAYLMKEEEAYV